MELTPEKFETAEFTERRRGYDIDQVETFLEETGTEFAQMLAKFRHTEQRAAAAEARLAEVEAKLSQVDQLLNEADQRVRRAEDAARSARAEADSLRNSAVAAPATPVVNDQAEVERVAKTLVIAQRAADDTIAEAKARAESLLDEARGRADRQMAEAINEAEVIVSDARRRAEEEFADRHAEALGAVTELEGRRSQIEGVITELEDRLSGYREDLQRTAAELNSLAEDPSAIGPREGMSILPDEVITSSVDPGASSALAEPSEPTSVEPASAESTTSQDDLTLSTGAPAEAEYTATPEADSGGSDSASGGSAQAEAAVAESSVLGESAPVAASVAPVASTEATGYLDLTSGSGGGAVVEETTGSDTWGPGSWSEVESSLDEEPVAARERVSATAISTSASTAATTRVGHFGGNPVADEQVDERPTQAVPSAATHRDKYLEELDQAVNATDDPDDEALAAFLDGGVDSKARRFGWRR